MQNFSSLVAGEHFQIWGWMEWSRKMCIFSRKLAIYLGNDERYS